MRIILNLSTFVFMWLSLINASFQDLDTVECVLKLDLKLICDGNPIECVCNHGAEPRKGLYQLKLDFSEFNQEDTFFQWLADELILPLVQQFQGVNHWGMYYCFSIRLLKQDPTHEEGFSSDEECETLLHSPLAELHNRFDPEKGLVLEVNLEQGTSF